MDYATLLENVMDVSHVPFTHHNSVGKRENATPVVLEMEGDPRGEGIPRASGRRDRGTGSTARSTPELSRPR